MLRADPERPTLMRKTIPPHVEAALPTVIAIVAAVWGWMRPAPARPAARYHLGLPDSAQVVGSFAAHCAGALCFTR